MLFLIESQYLPPIATFSAVRKSRELIFDYHSNYIKGSYRNRCYIFGVNGKQRLSIPLVKGKHQRSPMRAVKISYDENWQKHHWQSIITAYNRSPFFEYYQDELKELLFEKYEYLVDLNTTLFLWLLKQLQLDLKVDVTNNFIPKENKISDFRDLIHPQFSKMDYIFEAKPYEQVFLDRFDFIPNLSIIDLLFAQGPEAKRFI